MQIAIDAMPCFVGCYGCGFFQLLAPVHHCVRCRSCAAVIVDARWHLVHNAPRQPCAAIR